jgi:hypothetical protein
MKISAYTFISASIWKFTFILMDQNFTRHVQIKVKYKLKLILADFTFQWAPSPRANKWFPFWTSWMWDALSLEIMISTLVLTLWWAMWRKQIFLGKKIKLKFVKWLNVELHFGIWRKNCLYNNFRCVSWFPTCKSISGAKNFVKSMCYLYFGTFLKHCHSDGLCMWRNQIFLGKS